MYVDLYCKERIKMLGVLWDLFDVYLKIWNGWGRSRYRNQFAGFASSIGRRDTRFLLRYTFFIDRTTDRILHNATSTTVRKENHSTEVNRIKHQFSFTIHRKIFIVFYWIFIVYKSIHLRIRFYSLFIIEDVFLLNFDLQ